MTRTIPRSVAIAASLLLVGMAVVACNRHDVTAPSPSPSVVASASSSASDSGLASASASAGGSVSTSTSAPTSASASASVTAGASERPTPDAVASELDQINQLINDINDAISGSDSSQQGGE